MVTKSNNGINNSFIDEIYIFILQTQDYFLDKMSGIIVLIIY